jgi:hypothetical protein
MSIQDVIAQARDSLTVKRVFGCYGHDLVLMRPWASAALV